MAGRTLTLNTTIQYRHFGVDDSTFTSAWNTNGRHMAAKVSLLTRNIKVDGSDGGWWYGYGGRILVGSVMEQDGADNYWRSGYGQFRPEL